MQELDTFSESGTTTGKSTALESAEMGQSDSGKFSATKVKKVLDLIKDETQFLLDMKARQGQRAVTLGKVEGTALALTSFAPKP